MALSPVMVELKAGIGEFKAKMAEARMEVEKLANEGARNHERMAAVGKAALFGFAGAAIAVGVISVKAAMDGQQAHAMLAQAIRNTGGSMEQLEPSIRKGTAAFANLGFTRAQYEAGLASMTTSLGSATRATGAMGLAADLARYKHIDLTTATIAVAKAMEGQLRPLKQLGIDLPVASEGALKLEKAHTALAAAQDKVKALLERFPDALSTSSKHHAAYEKAIDAVRVAHEKLSAAQSASILITKALSDRIGGQAAAQAATFSGQIGVVSAKLENMGETIGNKLIPFLTKAIGVISQTTEWFKRHQTTTEALAVAIGTVLAAAIGVYISTLIKAGYESVVNFAKMLLSATAWAAETLLKLYIVVAQFVIMTARFAVMVAVKLAGYIAMAAAATAAFIAENLATLGIIAGIALLIAAAIWLYKNWDQVWGFIKTAFAAGLAFVKDHLGYFAIALGPIGVAAYLLYKNWSTVWSGIKAVVSSVWDAIRPIFSAIGSGVSTIVSGLGSVVGAAKSVGGAISGLGIPGFAGGVDNFTGGLAMVGEAGPELVRLPRGSSVIPAPRTSALLSASTGPRPLTINMGAVTVSGNLDNVTMAALQAALDKNTASLVTELTAGRR